MSRVPIRSALRIMVSKANFIFIMASTSVKLDFLDVCNSLKDRRSRILTSAPMHLSVDWVSNNRLKMYKYCTNSNFIIRNGHR
jgi:hypothetical protein